MHLKKVRVRNFRVLKDVSIDLETKLSVIIGKNNTGKTSLLLVLEKFLGSGPARANFTFDDFSTDFKDNLKARVEGNIPNEETFPFLGISLKLYIEYGEDDDLSNIGNKVIMDLDADNNTVVLAFEYSISEDKLAQLQMDYQSHCIKRAADDKKVKDLFSFLNDKHHQYFQLSKKSVFFDIAVGAENDKVFTDLIKEGIRVDRIISFKWISARRNVSNKDSERTLSTLSSKIYNKLEAGQNNPEVIENFKDALSSTDEQLNGIYSSIFEEVIDDVKRFGGIAENDSIIKIVSSLQHKDLLEENTTVMYGMNSNDHSLPENYNGLGYMNLISMIFEIKILLHEFEKEPDEKPSDINLLFIEEPEVHTHPQMQCIFIKNIKSLLENGIVRPDGLTRSLQTIISTHSSHIVSEGDFEDLKYFKKENGGIISKNLKDLRAQYAASLDHYMFLKQYLTLHRSELFFVDKAVFIEGDTERILLPAMMKKVDQEDFIHAATTGVKGLIPLLSQNISIIEVGAYSQIFEKFIHFIGVKSLVLTDIDSVKAMPRIENGVPQMSAGNTPLTDDISCPVANGTKSSNTSLAFFYGDTKTLADLISMTLDQRRLRKDGVSNTWVNDANGNLLCVYQVVEANGAGVSYHARSFEDAFFHTNIPFIKSKCVDAAGVFIKDNPFTSLVRKYLKAFVVSGDAYELATLGVDKKPSFAMEILLNSAVSSETYQLHNGGGSKVIEVEFSNWNTPKYIREGLKWLKQ